MDALNKVFAVSPRPRFIRVWRRDADSTETPVVSLGKALEANQFFFSFAFTDGAFADPAAYVLVQTWAGANSKLFCATVNAAEAVDASSDTDAVFLMNAAGVRESFVAYHDVEKYSAFCIAALYSGVNYSSPNSVISAFGKAQPYAGLDLGLTAYNTLKAKGATYYTRVTLGSETNTGIVDNPVSCSSFGESISDIFDSYAFVNSLTANLFSYLTTSSTKVPQTPSGQAGAIASTAQICEQFFTNGYLGSRTYVDSTSGASVLASHGYVINTLPEDILSISSADRADHKLAPISVTIFPTGEAWSIDVTVDVEL